LFKLQKEEKKKEKPKPEAFQEKLINVFWASSLGFRMPLTAIKIRKLDHPLQQKASETEHQSNNRKQYFI